MGTGFGGHFVTSFDDSQRFGVTPLDRDGDGDRGAAAGSGSDHQRTSHQLGRDCRALDRRAPEGPRVIELYRGVGLAE